MMRKIPSIFLLAVCAAVMLCSCSKAKNITVGEDKVTFAITEGVKSIAVTADGSYEVTDCPDWLKAEAGDTTLTLTAQENKTGAVRECVINLVGDEVSVPITVTQADKCTYITVSEAEVTIPKEGGSKELTIDTDGAKLVMEASEGIPAEIKDGKLTINAPANEGGTVSGTVTLACDTVITEVKVTLEGSVCPTCNGTGTIICPKCKGKGEYKHVFDQEFGDYDLYGCTKCGGRGVVGEGYSASSVTKGKGRITCPDCGGAGH